MTIVPRESVPFFHPFYLIPSYSNPISRSPCCFRKHQKDGQDGVLIPNVELQVGAFVVVMTCKIAPLSKPIDGPFLSSSHRGKKNALRRDSNITSIC